LRSARRESAPTPLVNALQKLTAANDAAVLDWCDERFLQ